MTEAVVIFITTDTHESACVIAEKLVKERLVACINIVPHIESIYYWEDKICHDQELLLIAKTERKHCEQIEATVLELHHYTNPEVVILPIIGGSAPYLKWLAATVNP
jgi:periplasmic divalent cation tolerance protein